MNQHEKINYVELPARDSQNLAAMSLPYGQSNKLKGTFNLLGLDSPQLAAT